jgi:UDP-N-acetylmuramoyl-tripeptide--D-alanyl-D-alanine ligase
MTAQWGVLTAEELIKPVRAELVVGSVAAVFSGISTDSRTVKPGDLFVALKGEQFDGHEFIPEVIAKGAAGILIQAGRPVEWPNPNPAVVMAVTDTLKALGDLAFWWRRQHKIGLAAITGSVGKTTTKEMTAAILELSFKTLKNKGNFNNLIGLPLTLLTLDPSYQRAVLEMGMNQPGEIARLTEIAGPDVGLITNVAAVHLEGLGDIMGVAKAKIEMLEKISMNAQVALNGDDELLLKFAEPFRRKIVTFGLKPRNDIRATEIRDLGPDGTVFQLQYQEHSFPIRLRVPGSQYVYNALAAAAIALKLREPMEKISRGLEAYRGVAGRFNLNHLSGDIILIDDTYNSNPYALKAALKALSPFIKDKGRLLVGLGEMLELGKETVSAHLEAGTMVAETQAAYFWAMGEHAKEMISGALEKGFPENQAEIIENHEQMIRKIKAVQRPGDVIFLKGSRRIGLDKVAAGLKQTATYEEQDESIKKNSRS